MECCRVYASLLYFLESWLPGVTLVSLIGMVVIALHRHMGIIFHLFNLLQLLMFCWFWVHLFTHRHTYTIDNLCIASHTYIHHCNKNKKGDIRHHEMSIYAITSRAVGNVETCFTLSCEAIFQVINVNRTHILGHFYHQSKLIYSDQGLWNYCLKLIYDLLFI